MRCQTAGPAEQAESRNLAENIVGRDGGRLLNLFSAENRRAGRHVPEDLFSSGYNAHPFLGQLGQFQVDLKRRAVLGAKVRRDGFGGEAIGIDTDVVNGRVEVLDSGSIGGAYRCLSQGSLLFGDGNAGSFDRQSLGIVDRDVNLASGLQKKS